MRWLERHAWWGLLAIAVLYVAFGITDILGGPEADPGIPLGLTGSTLVQLNAGSPPAYRLYDFYTRLNGLNLIVIGIVSAAILLLAFRRKQRWAWWTMWVMPLWTAGIGIGFLMIGVEPTQAPPPPMISAPIFAILSVAILLVSAPRFVRAD